MSKVRDLFTEGEIVQAVTEASGNNSVAAGILSISSGHKITRQHIEYWRKSIVFAEEGAKGPKVLIFDIETAPIKQYIWSYWHKFHNLEMTVSDWFILSYSAKWLHAPEEEIFYEDLRGVVGKEDDSILLTSMHKLLSEADVVITQNGNSFDIKKLNARFILQGFDKPTPYKKIDTLLIAKKEFGFTSNKLEWMTEHLCVKYKKLKHGKFAGFKLWSECLNENLEAWEEMEQYNKYDVLSLEELYLIFRPWDSKHPNFNLFDDEEEMACNACGSTSLTKNGFARTNLSKFQQYKCNGCGKPDLRGRTNLLSKEQRASLLMNVGS